MRTIKFRGKVGDVNEWVCGYLVGEDKIYQTEERKGCKCGVGVFRVEPNTIGQFTGLHDVNGTEICEGDILRIVKRGALVCEPIIGTVVYSPYTAMFMIHVKIDYFGFDEIGETGKVIGNKFDNPELLGDEEWNSGTR